MRLGRWQWIGAPLGMGGRLALHGLPGGVTRRLGRVGTLDERHTLGDRARTELVGKSDALATQPAGDPFACPLRGCESSPS